jgi:DNA (cytosine-5)-methyltransferase 1
MCEMTVIDFFCGGGGFSEGFRQAGFKVIWAIDNWKPAVNTHKENHPDGETICDGVIRLSLLPDEEFDLVIAQNAHKRRLF